MTTAGADSAKRMTDATDVTSATAVRNTRTTEEGMTERKATTTEERAGASTAKDVLSERIKTTEDNIYKDSAETSGRKQEY